MGSMMCMALLMHTEEARVALFDPHTLRGLQGCGTLVFGSLLDACRYIVLEALPYSGIETLDEREITALIPGVRRLG